MLGKTDRNFSLCSHHKDISLSMKIQKIQFDSVCWLFTYWRPTESHTWAQVISVRIYLVNKEICHFFSLWFKEAFCRFHEEMFRFSLANFSLYTSKQADLKGRHNLRYCTVFICGGPCHLLTLFSSELYQIFGFLLYRITACPLNTVYLIT